jgi:HK97 family phage portal protein
MLNSIIFTKKYYSMDFHIGLDGIRINFFNSSRKYSKTPQTQGVPYLNLNDNKEEILYPENWDAYNVASTTSQLSAVIAKRGDMLANGQWQHIKIIGDKEEIVKDSPFVKLLEHPNPFQEGNDYLRLWNQSRCIYGNEFEFIVKSVGFAEISVLNYLPPSDIEVLVSGKWYMQSDIKNVIKGFKYQQLPIDIEEINYTWIPNTKNPLIGESPMNSLYMEISNIRAAMKFRNTIMAKRGALGILSNQGGDGTGSVPLSAKERENIENQWKNDYGIDDNQMQTLITNASLQYTPMSFPTQQLMLFEEVEDDFQSICSTYGIAREIFPMTNGATFNNRAEAEKQTYNNTIIPIAEELAMNRTQLFGLDGNKEFMRLDYSHIPAMQEDKKESAEVAKLRSQAVSGLIDKGFTPEQITQITGIEF